MAGRLPSEADIRREREAALTGDRERRFNNLSLLQEFLAKALATDLPLQSSGYLNGYRIEGSREHEWEYLLVPAGVEPRPKSLPHGQPFGGRSSGGSKSGTTRA